MPIVELGRTADSLLGNYFFLLFVQFSAYAFFIMLLTDMIFYGFLHTLLMLRFFITESVIYLFDAFAVIFR